MMSLLKNHLIFVITGFIPIIKSYKPFYLPICTTKECASNFNFLLMNEKTFNSFYFYLLDHHPDGAKLLNFWIDINLFRFNQKINKSIQILSTDIYEKYMKEGSELYIDFPSNLIEDFQKSYLLFDKSFYTEVFDELSEFVYESLSEYYFPIFKDSESYRKLRSELENDEILYSRLVQSSMISTEMTD